MESLSQLEPEHWFIFLGLISVAIARYGTHLVMPVWVEFSLRWGGWALIAFGVLGLLGLFDAFFKIIPL